MFKEDLYAVSQFDWRIYVKNYEDLRQNGILTEEKALEHWNKHGREEGRISTFLITEEDVVPDDFNWKTYMENYEDLVKAGLKDKVSLWKHWDKHGKFENRKHLIKRDEQEEKTPYYFDNRMYLRNYPLIKRVLRDHEDGWTHFSHTGRDTGKIYVNTNEYMLKLYVLYTCGRDVTNIDMSSVNKKELTLFTNYINSQVGIRFDKLEVYIMLEQFYYETYNFVIDLKSAYKLIMQDRKDHFRYLCFRYINYINTFPLISSSSASSLASAASSSAASSSPVSSPASVYASSPASFSPASSSPASLNMEKTENAEDDVRNETVLIEFRKLRNVEFVVKNMILKLPTWKHTVVCGNDNYEFLSSFLPSFVNIIKLNVEECNIDMYSKLLTSPSFWRMLTGKHILIYQDDTHIFNSNIDKWLKYDYVGAPWPQDIYPEGYRVGNGGFSLRRRELMLSICEKYDITTFPAFEFTRKYMRENKLKLIPEDCFFVKCIKDYNLGKIPNETEATYFSSESIKNYESVGMHCCWLSDSNWVDRFLSSVKKMHCCNINMLTDFTHRFGWNSLLRILYVNDVISLDNEDVQFVDLCEKYFNWDNKRIEEGKKWIGIFHLTPTSPDNLESIDKTLKCKNFIDAKKDCLFIIVFAEHLKKYLSSPNFPPIKVLKHPILTETDIIFDFSLFQKKKKIVQIGKQLRVLKTFLITPFPSYEKVWLIGSYDSLPEINRRLNYEFGESVNLQDFDVDYKVVNNQKYDEYFVESIIFVHVYDSVANNTVLESILYKTPIVINKHPAVVEYLGEDYPLYFDKIEELTEDDFLNEDKILSAHQHLCNIDMTSFSYSTFFHGLHS
jgi:hypothetical protein